MPHTGLRYLDPLTNIVHDYHIDQFVDALLNTPTFADLQSPVSIIGAGPLGSRPASASTGQGYIAIDGGVATVYIWASGAWQNAGTLQGPEGPQGDTGAQGIPGPQGEQGPAFAEQLEGETSGEAVAGIALEHPTIPGAKVETWLGTKEDGSPTSYAVEKLNEAGIGGGSVEAENAVGIAGGFLFENGRASWLTTTADGAPTEYAITKLEEAGISAGGGGAVDSVNGQTGAVVLDATDVGALPDDTAIPSPIVALGSEWRTYAEHPRLVKPLDAPILAFADQSAPTIYAPVLVDRAPMGERGVTMLYSTDHHTGAGGIYGATADSPLDTFAADGLLYVDSTDGDQTETPAAMWDEANSRYNLYYQNDVVTGFANQATVRATTPDLATFTRVGTALDVSGATHTGYFRPFRYEGSWYGYSLFKAATTPPTFAFWSSPDGATWTKIGEPAAKPTQITGLAGNDGSWIVKWYWGDVILWHGAPWWIGQIGPSASGAGVVQPLPLFAAPLGANLMSLDDVPVDITPPAQAWEQGGINNVGGAIVYEGRCFLPYRAGDDLTTNAAFGVMEIV